MIYMWEFYKRSYSNFKLSTDSISIKVKAATNHAVLNEFFEVDGVGNG